MRQKYLCRNFGCSGGGGLYARGGIFAGHYGTLYTGCTTKQRGYVFMWIPYSGKLSWICAVPWKFSLWIFWGHETHGRVVACIMRQEFFCATQYNLHFQRPCMSVITTRADCLPLNNYCIGMGIGQAQNIWMLHSQGEGTDRKTGHRVLWQHQFTTSLKNNWSQKES